MFLLGTKLDQNNLSLSFKYIPKYKPSQSPVFVMQRVSPETLRSRAIGG